MQQSSASEESETLAALILRAELFCRTVESAVGAELHRRSSDELRLKISQCRGALARLQTFYDDDELSIGNAAVRGDTRNLVMALIWVAFYAREKLRHKDFRQLVMIESSFTFLLISAISRLEYRLP
jgi:hypothetical protein